MHSDREIQPRATAPREEPMVCAVVNHAARLLSQAITARLAALGVSLGQLPTLLALYEQDGLTQSDLARRTGVEQPTMALNLRRMERDGLITRTPDPSDARRALVTLTLRANELRDPVRELRAGIDAESLTGFTPAEHARLRDFLDRMTANLDAMVNGPAPAPPVS
ncbi:MarR family transcriptional regulator [Streptomyces sp. NBC_01343]|uniref:MarR family winged helix-turn-helix transcriptional regulator n=1 Tax=Streptomyces sp. NBC_01343 TaxID=2903832 RepID=UPI002E143A38|nr:MarR family transcriptional regulator [Streptomyces sp. NBC_01343]